MISTVDDVGDVDVDALRDLHKLIRSTSAAVGQTKSTSRINKYAQSVQAQLDLLSEIFDTIEQRGGPASIGPDKNSDFELAIRKIQHEVIDLRNLAQKVGSTKTSKASGLFKRAKCAVTGYDKQFKERRDQLGSLRESLRACIAEPPIQPEEPPMEPMEPPTESIEPPTEPAEPPTESARNIQLRKILRPLDANFIPSRLAGTLEWIWTHETFQRWNIAAKQTTSSLPAGRAATSPNLLDRLCLIYGGRGCGKSVLASYIVEELKEQGNTTLSFSFWSGHGEDRRADSMLRTLLWQLLEGLSEEQQDMLVPDILDDQLQLRHTNFLALAIQNLVQDCDSEIYCVIDNINESIDNWNNANDSPMDLLVQLIQDCPNLHLLLLGTESSLRVPLQRWPLQIELTGDVLKEDRDKFISSELESCLNIEDATVRKRIQEQLGSKSTATFLWIKLVFEELRSSSSPAGLSHELWSLPTGLDRQYRRMFWRLVKRLSGWSNNISIDVIRAKGLFSLLSHASRPLTLMELRLAYAFSYPLTTKKTTNYAENLLSEENIAHVCGDFVSEEEGRIFLQHTSIKDFLVRPINEWSGQDSTITYLQIESRECHRIIGLACLKYLQQVNWKCVDESNGMNNLTNEYPFLNYASGHAISHLLQSSLTIQEVSSRIPQFLSPESFVSWMEHSALAQSSETHYDPPSINFWINLAHIWNQWVALRKSNDEYANFFTRMKQEAFKRYQTYGPNDHRAMCLALVLGHGFNSGADVEEKSMSDSATMVEVVHVEMPAQKPAVIEGKLAVSEEKPTVSVEVVHVEIPVQKHVVIEEKLVVSDEKAVQRLSKEVKPNETVLSLQQLAHALPAVNSSLRTTSSSIDPLNLLAQSMGQPLSKMSFSSLILLANAVQIERPKEAVRLFQEALVKVGTKGEFFEAWVQGQLGDCFMVNTETKDQALAEGHYRKSLELLQSTSEDPFIDIMYGSIACCHAKCLFALRRTDKAKAAASEAETRLTRKTISESDPKDPADAFCDQLADSPYLIEMKREQILRLGQMYLDEGMNEDVERLLVPFTQDETDAMWINRKYSFEFLEILALAKERLGKIEDARDTWMKLKRVLTDSNDQDEFINYAKYKIACAYHSEKNFEDAAKELGGINIASFYIGEVQDTLECLLSTCSMLEKREEMSQLLETQMPAITAAFTKHGIPANTDRRVVTRKLLKFGMFDESEAFIRSTINSRHDFDDMEEMYLYEALAFSLRFQVNRPKRTDPYHQYLCCLELMKSLFPELRATRLYIGLGMTCLASGRRKEATRAFDIAAESCQYHSCGSHCVLTVYDLFYSALARQQDRDVIAAMLLFSRMHAAIDDKSVACKHVEADYEVSLLSITGHMCLAEIFDGCGIPFQGDVQRRLALEKLQKEFKNALDPNCPPLSGEFDPQIWTWTRYCEGYILGRKEGRIGADVGCELFPFDVLWPTLGGGDKFNLLSYRRKHRG